MFSAIPNFSGTTYYKDVYNAAKGNTTTLMSIDSKEGAFMYNPKDETGLKPNIIFGNGQFLWILSDKTASIPGLTYTTVDNTPSRNVCKNLNKITESACTTAGGYYCASEHGCYTMEASSLNEETKGLGDSRNCCAAPDLSDIAEEIKINPNYTTSDYYKDVRYYAISGFTVFVDINGTRGTGTLWEDVFPFYVSSNGSVYPAYPLDTMKYSDEDGKINKSQLLGGNSSKLLPVDVYYFSTVSGKRTKKVAFSGISYARAMCSMKKVSYYAPYCRNLESKFYAGKYNNEPVSSNSYLVPGSKNNPCNTETCFMSLRRRFMSF
jgi:hypothetical protein